MSHDSNGVQVFVVEQKFTVAQEIDGLDEQSVHFIALDPANAPAATLRYVPATGQIGRVAVLKRYRGIGLGQIVMEACIRYAKEASVKELHLHSQDVEKTKRFYERVGFESEGPVFEEDGMGHVNMVLKVN